MAEGSATGVEVKAGFFPLMFILYLCPATIEIDGTVAARKWGTHFLELPPGDHTVKVYFKYLWMSQCGANSVTVTVQQGRVTRVKYSAPPLVFLKGSIKQV